MILRHGSPPPIAPKARRYAPSQSLVPSQSTPSVETSDYTMQAIQNMPRSPFTLWHAPRATIRAFTPPVAAPVTLKDWQLGESQARSGAEAC